MNSVIEKFNLNLLKDLIYCDALGITPDLAGFWDYSRGSALQADAEDIDSIKAYIKISGFFGKVLSPFNLAH